MPFANVWMLHCCNAPGVKDQTQQLNATIISRAHPDSNWSDELQSSVKVGFPQVACQPSTLIHGANRSEAYIWNIHLRPIRPTCLARVSLNTCIGWFSIAVEYLGQFWTVSSFIFWRGGEGPNLHCFWGFPHWVVVEEASVYRRLWRRSIDQCSSSSLATLQFNTIVLAWHPLQSKVSRVPLRLFRVVGLRK